MIKNQNRIKNQEIMKKNQENKIKNQDKKIKNNRKRGNEIWER